MQQTRRAFIATTAGATTVALAGCLGGGGGSESGSGETVDELPTPVIGDPEASLTVQVWEDFSCPHCATYSLDALPKLRSEYIDEGRIRYEHHDLPIPVNQQWSWATASAARAVQDQTDAETFFEYTHALFENQGSYSMDLIASLAADVGADGELVRAAAENVTYRPVLEADKQAGLDMGAEGTPAVFVGGELVRPVYADIKAAIDAKL